MSGREINSVPLFSGRRSWFAPVLVAVAGLCCLGDASGQYANMTLPPGLSMRCRPFAGLTNTVGDLAADPSELQNGYSIFTLDSSGFRAANYLDGWSEPDIPL